jgi:predicted TIM-barrel fold metal-dependent hydrolase
MRIDVHAHYFTKEYLDLLDEMGGVEPTTRPGRRSLWPSPSADLEARFAAMDRASIDVEILSVSGVAPYFMEERKAIAGARLINDTYAELARAYPGRFCAYAALPLPHIDASLAELARAMDTLGAVGATVSTSVFGKGLGDPQFDPLWEELDRRNAVLFVHPAGLACHSPEIRQSDLQWVLGAPVEDALCALQLIQAGIPVRFPKMRVIIPHLGGVLPFIIHRLHELAPRFVEGAQNLSVRDAVRSFWYDTVNGLGSALSLAREVFGAERLVFGTDYPFWRDEAHQWAATYVETSGLPADELEQIFSGNAESLFAGRIPQLRPRPA